MNCPSCSKLAGHVVESRPFEGRQRRRYKCGSCNHLWNTVEVPEEEYQAVEEVRMFRANAKLAGLLVPRLLAMHGELTKLMEAVAGKSLGAIRQKRSREYTKRL